jgi:hypothetical protein
MRGYLRCIGGSAKEEIAALQQLSRGDKVQPEDPYSYLYGYLYSLVLPGSGTEDLDDRDTVLSRTLAQLQEKAGRIESPAHRISFLTKNRWNRLLMEDAKARRLA